MTPTPNALRSHAKWASIGTFSLVSIQLLTLVFLARLMGPTEMGIAATCTLVIQFLYIFSDFGIGTLVIQRRVIDSRFLTAAHQISCLASIAITSCIFFSASQIAEWFDTPQLRDALRIYSIYLVINGAIAVRSAQLQRDFRYRELAKADILSYVIGYGCVSLILAGFSWSYWSIIGGYLAQICIKYCLLPKGSDMGDEFSSTRQHAREFLSFGVGQSLSRTGSYVAGQVDTFLVASQMGMASTGIYSRAHQLATMPANQLGSIFDKVIFPYVARAQDDTQSSRRVYYNNLSAVAVVGVSASVLMWVTGDLIVSIVLGNAWQPVAEPLKILSVAIPLRLVQHVSDPTARALGSTYGRAWRQWIFAGLTAAITFWLSAFGLSAVAWGVVGAAAVNAILMIGLCGSLLRCSTKALVLYLLPAAAMALIAGLLVSSTPTSDSALHNPQILVGVICSASFCGLLIVYLKQKRRHENLL